MKRHKLDSEHVQMDEVVKVKEKTTKKSRKKPVRFKRLKRIWRLFSFSIFALFVWLMYCYVVIISHPYNDNVEQADAAVVLGAALWNERPSPALRERLNHALALFNDNKVDKIIVSGGKGDPNLRLSEAEGMRNYLMEQGVPEQDIIMEQHATNTYENLLLTKKLIEKYQIDDVIFVSHSYHAYRTDKIAHFLNYSSYQVSGIDSQVLNKPYHYTREVLAYSKWVLNSLTLRLGFYID